MTDRGRRRKEHDLDLSDELWSERADTFDPLLSDVADAIERGADPHVALDDHAITDSYERETLEQPLPSCSSLHAAGRDHIWAYYTRNLVRPVVLSREKVDVVIGNPPWLIYPNG